MLTNQQEVREERLQMRHDHLYDLVLSLNTERPQRWQVMWYYYHGADWVTIEIIQCKPENGRFPRTFIDAFALDDDAKANSAIQVLSDLVEKQEKKA